jgi:septation ring formation regulator EzrA
MARIANAEALSRFFRGTKTRVSARKREKQAWREGFIRDIERYEIALEKRLIKDSVGLLKLEKELGKLEEQIEKVEAAIEENKGDKSAIKTYGAELEDLEAKKVKKEKEIDALFGEKAILFRKLRRTLRRLKRKIREQDEWTRQEAAEIGSGLRKMYLAAQREGVWMSTLGEAEFKEKPSKYAGVSL